MKDETTLTLDALEKLNAPDCTACGDRGWVPSPDDGFVMRLCPVLCRAGRKKRKAWGFVRER